MKTAPVRSTCMHNTHLRWSTADVPELQKDRTRPDAPAMDEFN